MECWLWQVMKGVRLSEWANRRPYEYISRVDGQETLAADGDLGVQPWHFSGE